MAVDVIFLFDQLCFDLDFLLVKNWALSSFEVCAMEDFGFNYFWHILFSACLEIVQGFYCTINQILTWDRVIKRDCGALCITVNSSKICYRASLI